MDGATLPCLVYRHRHVHSMGVLLMILLHVIVLEVLLQKIMARLVLQNSMMVYVAMLLLQLI